MPLNQIKMVQYGLKSLGDRLVDYHKINSSHGYKGVIYCVSHLFKVTPKQAITDVSTIWFGFMAYQAL